jgi:UDP-glucose 6-dehydrogenase
MNNDILLFKHDIEELKEGKYNLYSDDGALELKVDNIVITEEDKDFLDKTKKTKSSIGKLVFDNRTVVFKRAD